MKKFLLLLSFIYVAHINAQIITTVAGNGIFNPSTNGGQATASSLDSALSIAVDNVGNLYIAERAYGSVRKVNTSGIITTYAGAITVHGNSGDGGQATDARFEDPTNISIDANGNLFVVDIYNCNVRMVNSAGIISTVAGSSNGFSGDGGPATAAKLNYPFGAITDVFGNLYISDTYNNRIRKVNTAGVITTYAGTGTTGYSGDGGQATAAQINMPSKINTDNLGNVYFSEGGSFAGSYIRKITTAGIISTIAGTGTFGFSGDGGQATAAQFDGSLATAFDAGGNMYVADSYNNRVRVINKAGVVSTIAGTGAVGYSGDGGQATAATFHSTQDVAVDAQGNIFIADGQNGSIRKITNPCPLTFNGITTICAGSATTLSVSGATSYTWSANASNATTNTVSVSPSATTIYTVTAISGGCTNTATTTVNVNPEPTLTVNSQIICQGGTATLTASGASSYTWSTNETTAAIAPTLTATAIYTVSGTDANGCNGTTTSTVTVVLSPTITVAANSYTICNGASQTFTATGANSYTWYPTVTLANANTATPTASPNGTTVYTVTGSAGTCTANPQTVKVTTISLPTIVTNSISICAGTTATLQVAGANTYTWSTSATTATISVLPSATTNYTVTGADANGCKNTAVATVSVVASPTLAVNSATICAGITASLTANGASSYTWSTNETTATITPTPTATTIYTVSGSNANGCISTTTSTVTIYNPTPVLLSVSASSTIACAGGTTTLTASGANSYTWSSNAGSVTTNTAAVSPNSPTTYTVTGINTGACLSLAMATITLNVNPTPTVSISGPTSVCNFSNACFNAISNNILSTYYWDFSNGYADNTASTCYVFKTPGTCSVTLIVTDLNGCVGTTTTNVTVIPSPTITIQSTNAICSNACNGSATVTPTGGTPPYIINWLQIGNSIPEQFGLCVGTYSCVATDINGCTDSATTTITQLPSSTTITYTLVADTAPHTWDLYPNLTGGTAPYAYTWTWGDGSTSNTAYPSHTYSVAGTYSICVAVTDANGCSASYCQANVISRLNSSMITVNVINGTTTSDIKNITSENNLIIYPNPAQNNFTVEVSLNQKQNLQLFDVTGKQVLSQIINGTTTIDINGLDNGVYFIQLKSEFGVSTQKIIVQH